MAKLLKELKSVIQINKAKYNFFLKSIFIHVYFLILTKWYKSLTNGFHRDYFVLISQCLVLLFLSLNRAR